MSPLALKHQRNKRLANIGYATFLICLALGLVGGCGGTIYVIAHFIHKAW